MIKYTAGFVDKLEDILQESNYTVRYERGNFQSGWCLLDHKRVVVLNKFLNTEGRVNTLVELIPQLRIDYDKLTLNSQKLYDFLTENRLEQSGEQAESNASAGDGQQDAAKTSASASPADENTEESPAAQRGSTTDDHKPQSDEPKQQ